MNKKIKISDLCSRMNPQYMEDLEVTNMTDLHPSEQRIEDIVFQKLHPEQKTAAPAGKRVNMKKKTWKIAAIAAVFCLFATTAFAMAGGFEYFRSIYGDTVDNARQDILTPEITVTDGTRQMALDSMLTDGYKINLIVSLKTVSGKADKDIEKTDPFNLFQVELQPPVSGSEQEEQTMAFTCTELTEFSSKSQHFYHIQLDSLTDCTGWNLKVSLSESLGNLTLESDIKGSAAAAELTINQAIDSSLTIETLQISPLGFLVIGSEGAASGGLPTPSISLTFKDGSQEDLITPMSFDSGEGGTITGGGGVVIGEDPMTGPLVTTTYGQRNPSGKLAIAGEFGRIILVSEIQSISVNGTEYPLN